MTRERYTPEFKIETVRLVTDKKYTLAQAAREADKLVKIARNQKTVQTVRRFRTRLSRLAAQYATSRQIRFLKTPYPRRPC